jgi:hypothetical protein
MEYGRVKGQSAGVNTEEGGAADHLDTPVMEVERMVRLGGFRFRSEDRLIVETVRYRGFGQAGDT